MKLTELKVGEKAIVLNVDLPQRFKKRLFDIGISRGREVTLFHKSPMGDPRAYFSGGALIAIRNRDAEKIEVYPFTE